MAKNKCLLLNQEVQNRVDDAENDASDGDAPEIHTDARQEINREPDHCNVDDEGGEAEGEYGKGESENFEERFDDRVDERKDKAGSGIEHPGMGF